MTSQAKALIEPSSISFHVERSVRQLLEEIGEQPLSDLYDMVLAEVERPLLAAVLEHTRGNQTKAANMLGLNRGTLRKKIKERGLA